MAIALVQSAAMPRSGGGTSSVKAFTSNVTAGNLLVVVQANYTPGNPTVTGSNNGAFTKGVAYDVDDGPIVVWYKANCAGGAETITVSGKDFISACIAEFSGIATASPVDRTGSVANSLTVTASAANTQADDLVIAAFVANGAGSNDGWTTPLIGYTPLDNEPDSNSNTGYLAAYKIVSSIETSSATTTVLSGTPIDGVIITFKAAAAGTSLTPGQAAITLAGPVPTVARTANQALTPAQGAISFSGPVPTVARTANQALTPGVGSVAFAGQVPSVTQTAGTALVPGTGALTLSGPAPVLSRTANQALVPGVGAVAFTGYAPTVSVASASVSLVPGVAALTLTGYAPSVQQQGNVILLGGGPGGPAKRRKGGTESYLERLLGRPLDEEPEQQEVEIIERAVQIAATAPEPPTRDEAADALKQYGMAFRDAYIQIYQELEAKRRQELEDEQIAAIVALCL